MGIDERISAKSRSSLSIWYCSGATSRARTAATAPEMTKWAVEARANASSSRLPTGVAPAPPTYGCEPTG